MIHGCGADGKHSVSKQLRNKLYSMRAIVSQLIDSTLFRSETNRPVWRIACELPVSRRFSSRSMKREHDTYRRAPDRRRNNRNSNLIIDESGLNSLSQGAGIIKLALQNDYRVLFVGDARQHNSVESGDFFRLLEEHTQIPKATLTQIHRQQTAEYRKGIELTSAGLALEGFETLDHGGFVREGEGRYLEEAAESFMELTDQGKNPLNCIAVSPTHRECNALTAILREKLKAAGRLKAKTERNIVTFQSFGWTKAQLGNIANYQPGMKLFFTTRLKGVGKPGEMVGIEQVKSSGELVLSNGLTVNPCKIRSAVDVGKSTELPVAEGDLVRFTVNLKTPEFKISNGSLAIATAIPNEYRLLDAERRITGTVCLPESFHGIRHGWVMTSHASQGMTADHVVAAAEKMSKQAFYVGCSRGRFKLALHLPDRECFKEGLLRIPTERLSVADLVKSGEIEKPDLEHLRRIREQYDPDPYRLMRSCTSKEYWRSCAVPDDRQRRLSCPLSTSSSPVNVAGIMSHRAWRNIRGNCGKSTYRRRNGKWRKLRQRCRNIESLNRKVRRQQTR